MTENKTKPTTANAQDHIAKIQDETRREDCQTLARIMAKATKEQATMWGESIVGFGLRRYTYASGREGETCVVGFAARKGDISIYGTESAPNREALLEKLGKHKSGKACLYIRKLSDVDLSVLEALIAEAVQAKTK